jgi:hypothetical protein
MAKQKVLLDWYGNPIEKCNGGICVGDSQHFVMGEMDTDGEKWVCSRICG